MSEELESLRKEIDAIDESLLNLMNQRAEIAKQIGAGKPANNAPFFSPEREETIYKRLLKINKGPLEDKQVSAIFREIISAARTLEKALVVAFLGPEGTFTHMASLQRFGSSTTFLPVDTITDTFQEVERSNADYGVVPVENSTAGVVPETLDTFPQSNVRICAELYVQIAHHLASHQKSLDDVKKIYTHTQPAQQCRRWLRTYLPNAEIVEVSSTSKAAEMANDDKMAAAITNSLAAERVGIPLLVEHIEDNPHNRTRFLVIGYNEPRSVGKDKTSLMFTLRNQPGELYRALGAFQNAEVNLTMIESRPAQRSGFEYVFYADLQGHRSDGKMGVALKDLAKYVTDLTILGSYPEAE